MLVEAAMTPNVVTVRPQTTLAEAQELMRRGRFRHLPVMDGPGIAGIVSEREVRPPAGTTLDEAEAFLDQPVARIMHGPVITVAPNDSLEDAARLLFENKIGSLPVLRGGTLAGIITTTDLFHAFLRATGVLEPSSRVEVRTESIAPALARIAEVTERERAVIAGLITEHDPLSNERHIVVRFATLQGPRLVAALRAAGLDVIAPDPAIGEVGE